ncbi:MAG: hypothetical protein ACRDB3_17785 [Citrobacter telavivensis]
MIIVLNGPPGCGKDTIAKHMAMASPVFKVASMKEPMWDIAKATLGKMYPRFLELYNNRETKEVGQDFLGGLSPRKFFIHISEQWCKPLFGVTYFGERMLSTVNVLSPAEVVLSDGGFADELRPALAAGKVIMVVRLHRSQYSFAGDSRDYLKESDFDDNGIWFVDLYLKDGDINGAVEEVIAAYQSLRDFL